MDGAQVLRLLELDLSARLNGPAPAASNDRRQMMLVVFITIAEAAAVNKHAVVQQRLPIRFLNFPQAAEQVRHLSMVPAVDLGKHGSFLFHRIP